jgi:class 3 adenylate cyclase
MADLPTGTVTFLFTDIDGSTKLWERDAAAMQAALVRHDTILREAVEAHGGYVFKTVGDAFCVAYYAASDALEAALAAQRALLTESQENIWRLRVRMALHVGSADERGGDYFGPSVNRVARLLSAGRERLEALGETEEFRSLHAGYFLKVAEEADPELRGPDQPAWFERLEAEHDNMRAALSWALEGEPETARRLAKALTRFWEMRSYFSEGSRWLEAALRRGGSASVTAQADALNEAGMFAWHRGDYEQATALHAEALALSREPGDERTVGYALRNLGEVAQHRGEYRRAAKLGMESLSVFRELADEWHVASTLAWLGRITLYASDDLEAAGGSLGKA